MPREVWSHETFLPCCSPISVLREGSSFCLYPASAFLKLLQAKKPVLAFSLSSEGDKPCLAWSGHSMEFPRPGFCKGLKPFRLVRHCPAEFDLGVLQERGIILTGTREVGSHSRSCQSLPFSLISNLAGRQPPTPSRFRGSSGKGGSSRPPFRGRAERHRVCSRCRWEPAVPVGAAVPRARSIPRARPVGGARASARPPSHVMVGVALMLSPAHPPRACVRPASSAILCRRAR